MSIVHPDQAVELAPGVHWIGALDPHLRRFDITNLSISKVTPEYSGIQAA